MCRIKSTVSLGPVIWRMVHPSQREKISHTIWKRGTDIGWHDGACEPVMIRCTQNGWAGLQANWRPLVVTSSLYSREQRHTAQSLASEAYFKSEAATKLWSYLCRSLGSRWWSNMAALTKNWTYLEASSKPYPTMSANLQHLRLLHKS